VRPRSHRPASIGAALANPLQRMAEQAPDMFKERVRQRISGLLEVHDAEVKLMKELARQIEHIHRRVGISPL